MTSQKRYRHHQENHSARYRDLPPRFKRQKSSSSPPPTPVISPDNILQEISSKSESNNQLPTDMTSSSVFFNDSNRNDSSENFSQAKPSTALTNSLKWSALPKKEVPVLSSVDNQFFAPAVHIPLGTQFGYSPPLSPWNMGNMSVYTGQTTSVYKSDPWSQSHTETFVNQRLLSPAKINYNNENNVPCTVPPVAPWSKSYSPQLPSNLPTPMQNATAGLTNSQQPRDITSKPIIDYSDPDIRTIEMLRELERVADEKQNDDFGVDRKSLVSHHLRMLMCAVDRYTEGIEDELSSNEVVDAQEKQTYSARHDSHPVYFNKQDTQATTTMMWPKDDAQKVPQKGDSPKQVDSRWIHDVKMESSRVNKKQEMLLPEEGANCVPPPTWDLWSSPSFDICDVLSHPLPCNLSESELPHFDLFGNYNRGDSFNIDEVRPRKPLYKR